MKQRFNNLCRALWQYFLLTFDVICIIIYVLAWILLDILSSLVYKLKSM